MYFLLLIVDLFDLLFLFSICFVDLESSLQIDDLALAVELSLFLFAKLPFKLLLIIELFPPLLCLFLVSLIEPIDSFKQKYN